MQGNPMLEQNRFLDQFTIECWRSFRVPFLFTVEFHEYRELDSIPVCPKVHNKEWKVHGIRMKMEANDGIVRLPLSLIYTWMEASFLFHIWKAWRMCRLGFDKKSIMWKQSVSAQSKKSMTLIQVPGDWSQALSLSEQKSESWPVNLMCLWFASDACLLRRQSFCFFLQRYSGFWRYLLTWFVSKLQSLAIQENVFKRSFHCHSTNK